MTFRRALSIALAAAVLSLAPGVCLARPLDDVVASKVLRVAVYENNKPFSYSDGGKPAGVDVDIGKAIARELGVEAEFLLRMPGEEVDDDLRANVWKGPLTGGGVGDVMLHVPTDKEFALRNPQAVISNPYFEERVAVAIDPAKTGANPDFNVFKREKIGVKLGTVSDYFLMSYEDGALINNISHFTKPMDGPERFLAGETAALMGGRAEIEGLLHERGAKAVFVEPAMADIVRAGWVVGTAVAENSRDLGYAIGNALEKLRASGELATICAKYGVTFTPPPQS